jgi:23S rRNA (uracil1939-C5)-methyltransferase
MKKGDVLTIPIESAAFEGKAIGRVDGIPVFVKAAAPGDTVEVMITAFKKSYAEAKLLSVVTPGPDRIPPRCVHAGECGGCQWQHVSYESQAQFKQTQVRDLVHRIGGLREVEPLPTLRSERQYGYRNKMEYTFSDEVWIPNGAAADYKTTLQRPAGGLHAPGRFDKILDLSACHLPGDTSYALLEAVRTFARERGWRGYDTRSHEGFLRNLIVRNSEATGEWLAALVTTGRHSEVEELASQLKAGFPQLATFVHIAHQKKSPNHAGGDERILFGKGFIEDVVGGFTYQIHPLAFFQTNVQQANVLFETAIRFAEIKPEDRVFDLYCGVGTLTFMAARRAHSVTGIELSAEAIANAHFNAEFNKISNVTFVQGDMKDVFARELVAASGKPDVIITDPPRAGMHPDVVQTLLQVGAERMVYVSCNPATMARDLALMSTDYTVEAVQPVDMFPQTYHIECVSSLRRRSGL